MALLSTARDAARFTGDIGVADGRIVSIGKVTDSARRTINADGLTVSPGFIDGHTHMDAQVMWDPLGSCSCYHGVTTVVMSNCGFTLSPCKPADRKWYAECLSYVEDISTDAMSAGIDWTWETFPEYMAAVAKRPKALNHGMYIGHSGVRMYVMGRRALTDVASDDEVAQMKQIVQQGLRAGAIGFSSSRSHTHLTPGGTPVASRIGEWSEIERIVGGMGELNAGIFQVGPVLTSRTENQRVSGADEKARSRDQASGHVWRHCLAPGREPGAMARSDRRHRGNQCRRRSRLGPGQHTIDQCDLLVEIVSAV